MARRMFLTILALALAGGLALGAGEASAQVSCGDVITTNTRLEADLNCTGDGLIIGRDGITLNLGDHTITGDGDPDDVGISNVGHDDVTVRRGTIENFGAGVSVEGARRNLISGMTTSGGGYGIVVNDSRGTHLERNLAYGNDLDGITLAGGGGTLTENVASANGGVGITGGHTLRRNEASANAGDGIVAGGTLFRNRATDNAGSGIVARGTLRGNQALRNAIDGIVASGIVRGSRAIHNGRDGIFLADGCLAFGYGFHRNVASGNGRDGMHLLRCVGQNQANPTRAFGHEAARNGRYGIFLEDSRFIWLAGSTPGNLDGIHLESSHQNRIGALSTGNDDDGIELIGSNDNEIQRAVVSDNFGFGIAISGSVRNVVARSRSTENAAGISLVDSSRTYIGPNNVASDNNGNGIEILRGDTNRVTENRAARNNGFGITLQGSNGNNLLENRASGNVTGIGLLSSHANLLEANAAVSNLLFGIELGDSNDNRVRRGNVASENRSFGLAVTGVSSDNDLLGNHADGNGSDGIFVDVATSATLILHDRARENSDDGIDVESADATLTENRANRNADLGIEAVPGVTDGGGNAASGNGNPGQCANVACSP